MDGVLKSVLLFLRVKINYHGDRDKDTFVVNLTFIFEIVFVFYLVV